MAALNKPLFFLVFLCISSTCFAASPSGSTIVNNGAWSWFSDPRAVRVIGQYDRTYVGSVSSQGDIQVTQYDLVTKAVTNTIVSPHFKVDDHAAPSLLVRADKRLIVFYSGHNAVATHYRISDNPEDATSWGVERTIPATNSVTYSNPSMLSAENNRIYLITRDIAMKPTIIWSDDQGQTWTTNKQMITSASVRPYLKAVSNDKDEIHLTFTDGHPRGVPNNSVYYAKYKNGAFYRSDGTLIRTMAQLPFDVTECEKVYAGNTTTGNAWVWDIALDSTGKPAITYVRFPSLTNHLYHYARFTGQTWQDSFLTSGGGWFEQTPPGTIEPEPNYSGGVVLDHDDPSTVYLSRPVNGVFEIEHWSTPDGGATWQSSAVTSASSNLNVRPVVPRHHQPGFGAVWMNGNYVHFTNYNTAILANFDPNAAALRFAFGMSTAPLTSDYIRVSQNTSYQPSMYGWLDISGNQSRDRGAASDDIRRGFVFNSVARVFKVDLVNGTYSVSVTMGDALDAHDAMIIKANGVTVASGISTSAGYWTTRTFPVTVSNGTLALEFSDGGGMDRNWVVNAVEITE
jgi:hypothetical protein